MVEPGGWVDLAEGDELATGVGATDPGNTADVDFLPPVGSTKSTTANGGEREDGSRGASRRVWAPAAGRLDLGPWQPVFYCEFDGGGPKRVVIQAMGE